MKKQKIKINKKRGKMNKNVKNNFILIISIIFLLIILILKINSNKNSITPFGITILKVSSNSMMPTFKKDDIIIVKKEKDYEKGDIITYKLENNYLVTHRIIEKYENVFITKGDNNNTKDEKEVKTEDIIGKVIFIIKI